MIRDLPAFLGLDFPPLPYCAKCGGHYPTHTH